MAIPENQLVIWSHQGSITQSSATYQTIKTALESQKALYKDRSFEIFLQGSYGNDTNIYGESDVDIVIQLNGTFEYDFGELNEGDKNLFNQAYSNSDYGLNNFNSEVQTRIKKEYTTDVTIGNKSIKIAANGNRRATDVVPVIQYRKYTYFKGINNNTFIQGIKLLTSSGQKIINYPKLHSQNCTLKHQRTNSNFKPVVRIFKNIRQKLVAENAITKAEAPSYFIEGLLYNAPDNLFTGNYSNMVLNILNWLYSTTDKSKLICPNGQYYLIFDGSSVCWNNKDCQKFINATINLWNDWS